MLDCLFSQDFVRYAAQHLYYNDIINQFCRAPVQKLIINFINLNFKQISCFWTQHMPPTHTLTLKMGKLQWPFKKFDYLKNSPKFKLNGLGF